MNTIQKITVQALIHKPRTEVWMLYNSPEHIVKWNAASDDWHTTKAENHLQAGGVFLFRMEAKDGSMGFDFSGVYDEVTEHASFAYTMNQDQRKVRVDFVEVSEGTELRVTFEPEKENSLEMQQAGWQSILDSFKTYAEQQ